MTSRGGVVAPLDAPIESLPGVGADKRSRLDKLDLHTVRDLLFHLPRRYEDTRNIVPIAALVPGQTQTVRAAVVDVQRRTTMSRRTRKRMEITTVRFGDGSGEVEATWFNQRWVGDTLRPGITAVVSGVAEARLRGVALRNARYEVAAAEQVHVGTLAPVYRETKGLTSVQLRRWMPAALFHADAVADILPPQVREDLGLLPIADALRAIHEPPDPQTAEAARTGIGFREMFLLQVAAQRARRRRLSSAGARIAYDPTVARAYAAALPFTLTDGQRVAGHQILTDMAEAGPMNRLLQGDVGSGKTAVAGLAVCMAAAAGMQSVVMAPTEILARQHHSTLEKLLAPRQILPRLLVGSTPARPRREIVDALAAGIDSVVVGTHALIEDEVVFANLGLIVVDEQHRFGVAQRQRLRQKAEVLPNFLAMTATPIPRSLALTLYGDVNVSELRELPSGRTPVATRVVPAAERDAAYDFVRAQVAEGRQVFVICPLVEESDKLGVKSATAEFERLSQTVFPDLHVQLLHGRMAAREKDERMAAFGRGEADILVSTSVVEVGVDVPNASVIIIEAAERFGLAQLHQFRGRVGRGTHASFCLLFDSSGEPEALTRLDAVARTASGFDLAELDLRLRGPGDVAGLRQHGLPEMLAADLLDVAMGERARAAAARWLDHDPDLRRHAPLHDALTGYRAVFDLD